MLILFFLCYVITSPQSLRLSSSARRERTTGDVINLVAVDSPRYMEITHHLITLMLFPVQVSLSLYFLWDLLGPSCLASLVVMATMAPCHLVMGKRIKRLQVTISNNLYVD